jgi:hypothetical protein
MKSMQGEREESRAMERDEGREGNCPNGKSIESEGKPIV